MANISFLISMENPATHQFQVTMQIAANNDAHLMLQLAVWTPGSYLIREYAKNINYVKAFDKSGNKLSVEKSDKNTWVVANAGNELIVQYEVYAFEESVRTCWLDAEHASIIPAAFFLLPEHIDSPITIHIKPHVTFFKIATALNQIDNNKWARVAESKDELYDSPIEIGNHSEASFTASGVEHHLAIYGAGNYDEKQIINDLIQVIDTEVKIFKHHPCKQYLFILLNSNTLRGGLEHLHSTSLIFKRFDYTPRANYLEFISLAAHEYFHLWNVKRLRPIALGPFNYYSENYTTSLWIAEGFTSYYDDLIVYRAGISTEREYLNVVEKNINEAENAPGKHTQSVAASSFDAWIKYYRQNENSNNSQVNYYVRGALLTMLLDILIIHNSAGNYCLDDVMREAYHTFYLQNNRGFTEAEFKTILEKYAGENLDNFYANHVFGTEQPDLNAYFAKLGLALIDGNSGKLETDFGIIVNDRNMITAIRKSSAGELGGLNVNDELIAVNNFRYTSGLLTTFSASVKIGDAISITVNRNGIIIPMQVAYQLSDKVNYTLNPMSTSTDLHRNNYAKWLQR